MSFLKDRKSVEKLVDTIVYELEYIDNPEMLQVYVETLPPLFQRLGMELVKSFHVRYIPDIKVLKTKLTQKTCSHCSQDS